VSRHPLLGSTRFDATTTALCIKQNCPSSNLLDRHKPLELKREKIAVSDAAVNESENEGAGQDEAKRPWIAERVEQQMQPPAPAPEGKETKKARREREEREAVRELMARGAAENAAVMLAHEQFRLREEENRAKLGRPWEWPYVEEIAQNVLMLIEQSIPLADYAEYPGAPKRAGSATQCGIPSWVFRRWMEARNSENVVDYCGERISLRAAVARARDFAADSIADRHLHLAQVALERPRMSDAVRVAAEILRWQAIVRAPKRYAERPDAKAQSSQAVQIFIGTEAIERARVIEAETVPLLSHDVPQVSDQTG
jgi:hypothetical protein